MKKLVAVFAAVSMLSSAVVFAAPPKKSAKTAKVTDVWTCPMTGEAVKNHKGVGAPVVVGNYRVHFCCGGCPEAFAKLSAKDKQAKVAAAAKKDAAASKKKS